MRIIDQKSFLTGVVYIVAGVGSAGYSSFYARGDLARIGPGYFPLALGILLTLLGAIVSIRAVRLGKANAPGEAKLSGWRDDLPILLWIVVSVLLFALLLKSLGLLLSIAFLVIFSSLASHERNYRRIFLSAFSIALMSLGIFVYGLDLLLPLWPGFLGAP